MINAQTIAQFVRSGRSDEALTLLEEAETVYRRQGNQRGLAEVYHQQAALLISSSPAKALSLCDEAELLFRNVGHPLKAIQVRLTSSQVLLGQGRWQQARQRLDECQILLDAIETENYVDPTLHLRLTQLLAEITYVGYQQGANNLEELYQVLLSLAEQLEKVRRMRPGTFDTLWLFGKLDVYERIVAVAYQLGLMTQAANWAERTKSRRLLDLLLNLPFGQENEHEP